VRDEIEALGGLVIAPTDNREERVGLSPNGVWYEGSDLEYADFLIACAVANHNIDPRQIYVTGCSAGGIMAASMAAKRSNYVAAVAPSSGGSVFPLTLVEGTPAPAAFTMHGGEDDVVGISLYDASVRFQEFIASVGGFGIDCEHAGRHCGPPAELHEVAWEFMKAHPYGTSPSPYEANLPELPAGCRVWPE
jgi:hypothetical protein